MLISSSLLITVSMARTKKSVIIAAAAAAKKKHVDSRQEAVCQEQVVRKKQVGAACPEQGHDDIDAPEQFQAFRQLRRKSKVSNSCAINDHSSAGIKDGNNKRQCSATIQSSAGCSSPLGIDCITYHIEQPSSSSLTCKITGKKMLKLSTSRTHSPKQTPSRICSRERRSCVKYTDQNEDSGSLLQQMLTDPDIPQHSETRCRRSTKKGKSSTSNGLEGCSHTSPGDNKQ